MNLLSLSLSLGIHRSNRETQTEMERQRTRRKIGKRSAKICLIYLLKRHIKLFGSFDSITKHQCHRLFDCTAQIIYNWKYFNYWNSIGRLCLSSTPCLFNGGGSSFSIRNCNLVCAHLNLFAFTHDIHSVSGTCLCVCHF